MFFFIYFFVLLNRLLKKWKFISLSLFYYLFAENKRTLKIHLNTIVEVFLFLDYYIFIMG